MKKTGISLIVILLIGIYVVKENNLPNLDPETDVTQSNVLIKKPNWIITNKTSKNVYEISSYEAKQSGFEDIFLKVQLYNIVYVPKRCENGPKRRLYDARIIPYQFRTK